ncbi:UNVERIFIED_CONTAM: hypothetical protein FKN15_062311 [Acipenser sinensis]
MALRRRSAEVCSSRDTEDAEAPKRRGYQGSEAPRTRGYRGRRGLDTGAPKHQAPSTEGKAPRYWAASLCLGWLQSHNQEQRVACNGVERSLQTVAVQSHNQCSAKLAVESNTQDGIRTVWSPQPV